MLDTQLDKFRARLRTRPIRFRSAYATGGPVKSAKTSVAGGTQDWRGQFAVSYHGPIKQV